MRRSALLVAPSLVLLALTGACVVEDKKPDTVLVEQPQAKRPPAKQPPATPAPDTVDTIIPGSGTLILRNPNFATVNVEVRTGPNADCAQNIAFGTRQLQRGSSWTITSNQDVCWRRDANPDAPTGQWGSWNRQTITKGSQHEAVL